MKQFIALYFLFLGGLYLLFYLPNSFLSFWLNQTQTYLTLSVLDLFLKAEQLQGQDIWITPTYKIVITSLCNGLLPLLFLYASLLAYPSSFVAKIVWMIGGYIVFFVVNIVRILWVVFVTEQGSGHKAFYWSHDIVGNAFLMLTGLGLFILFIKQSTKYSKNV